MKDDMIEVIMRDSDQLTLHGIENTMRAAGYPEPRYWYMINYDYKQVSRDELLAYLMYFVHESEFKVSAVTEAADFVGWRLESALRWTIDDPRLRMRRSSGIRRCIVDYNQEQT